jgi:phage terminase Nu1 subunit (DNA packaging protein)
MSDNGQEQQAPDQIIITLNSRQPWQITISGKVESTNLALAMLQEAFRELETEWRLARAVAAQQKIKQEAADAERVSNLLNINRPRSH